MEPCANTAALNQHLSEEEDADGLDERAEAEYVIEVAAFKRDILKSPVKLMTALETYLADTDCSKSLSGLLADMHTGVLTPMAIKSCVEIVASALDYAAKWSKGAPQKRDTTDQAQLEADNGAERRAEMRGDA